MVRTRANPVRGFTDLMNEMERIRSLGRTGVEPGQRTAPRTEETAWVPTTDMFARGPDLVITTELAGVPASTIEITVSDGVVTISGERHAEPDGNVTPYLSERFFGSFRRSLALPEGVDWKSISAGIRDGLVTITVSGAADALSSRPHRIPLQEA